MNFIRIFRYYFHRVWFIEFKVYVSTSQSSQLCDVFLLLIFNYLQNNLKIISKIFV